MVATFKKITRKIPFDETTCDCELRAMSYAATEGTIRDETGRKAAPPHPRAGVLLREAAIRGELPRSGVVELLGMSERLDGVSQGLCSTKG